MAGCVVKRADVVADREFVFVVEYTSGEVHYFAAKDQAEMEAWMDAFREAATRGNYYYCYYRIVIVSVVYGGLKWF